MEFDFLLNLTGYLQSAIRLATPVLLASLGGLFTARVGIINFALEGIMIMGAFMAAWGAYVTGEPWFGVLFALGGGVLIALLQGFCSITAKVNQVVAATGINLFAIGLTSYLFGIGDKPSVVPSLTNTAIPGLSQIPVAGEIFFQQNVLTYVGVVMVFVCAYVINKTPFGLSLRAIGDHPAAADSLGINVVKKRYQAIIISGVLGGLAGAFLSVGTLSMFSEGMTAGKGYLAWATVTVGKFNPIGIMGAAALFGAAEALQLRMQAFGINFPHEALAMLPYILTMLVLAGVVGRTEAPHSMGKPYIKGQR